MTVVAALKMAGLFVLALSLAPALAWSPQERRGMRWPWLPLVEAAVIAVAGLGLAGFGAVLPHLT